MAPMRLAGPAKPGRFNPSLLTDEWPGAPSPGKASQMGSHWAPLPMTPTKDNAAKLPIVADWADLAPPPGPPQPPVTWGQVLPRPPTGTLPLTVAHWAQVSAPPPAPGYPMPQNAQQELTQRLKQLAVAQFKLGRFLLGTQLLLEAGSAPVHLCCLPGFALLFKPVHPSARELLFFAFCACLSGATDANVESSQTAGGSDARW